MHVIPLLKSFARLTEADWIAFALAVVFPIGLAVAGGILAALALPKEEKNAKRKKLFWYSGFALAGLTSLVLGLGQQKMAVDQRESDQKEAKTNLSDSEKREEKTQNKLDVLWAFIQTRPLGLTEADRGWMLSFMHTSSPTIKPDAPASAPSLSDFHERAAKLSIAVQKNVTSTVNSYKNATEQAKRDRYDAAIKRGETEEQARAGAGLIVTADAYNAEKDQIERMTVAASANEAPEIQRFLYELDSFNVAKIRGYRYKGQVATAEEGVTYACLPGDPHGTTCSASLEALANLLK